MNHDDLSYENIFVQHENHLLIEMDSIRKALTRLVAPQSLSLNGLTEKRTHDRKQQHEAVWTDCVNKRQIEWTGKPNRQSVGLPQPGDIILLVTAGTVYGLARKATGQKFDHAVVVLDEKRALHISPPVVRTLPLEMVLVRSRKPLVIRPGISCKERASFLRQMESLIGEPYSLYKFSGAVLNLVLKTMGPSNQNLLWVGTSHGSKDWICTDAILYWLASSSDLFHRILIKRSISGLDFGPSSSGSLSDFVRIADLHPELLRRVDLMYVERSPAKLREAEDFASVLKGSGNTPVFVFDDLPKTTKGQNHRKRKEPNTTTPQFRRFGMLGRIIDTLQHAFDWVVSKEDQDLLKSFSEGVKEQIASLYRVAFEGSPSMEGGAKLFGYLVVFLFLLKQSGILLRLVFRVVEMLVIRKILLQVWESVSSRSKL